MNTFSLRDANLSGPVIWTEDTEPVVMAHYINDNAGHWFSPTGDGAMIISDDWQLDVWDGEFSESDLDGAESDHTFTHYNVAPLADLSAHVTEDHDILLREVLELVDEEPPSELSAKLRAIIVEHIETSYA